jgi:hypothetical protein
MKDLSKGTAAFDADARASQRFLFRKTITHNILEKPCQLRPSEKFRHLIA